MIKIQKVSYQYTIEVEAYGPKEVAEQPATVTIGWPQGSIVVSLPGRRKSHTFTIPWAVPYSTNPEVFIGPIIFDLSVEVKKPGYAPFHARYFPGDFVSMADATMLRIDKVTLHQIPENVSQQMIEELSQALPCGLEVYATRTFIDFDGDGSPEAVLYRTLNPSASQSPLAEIRVMSLRDGKWISLFVANHQGVFISDKRVPKSAPAPNGYTFLRLGGGVEIVFEKLAPLDEPDRAATYLWRKGKPSFEILNPLE